MPVPEHPKIYHITHVANLAGMVDGHLWSDAERIRRGLGCTVVGMGEIKRRRLDELDVDCHPGMKVGQYVPFYFCPRSIMLYILQKGNSPGLAYTGGQRPIVHLQADLETVVNWADAEGRRYAFTKGNAGARYTVTGHDLSPRDSHAVSRRVSQFSGGPPGRPRSQSGEEFGAPFGRSSR